MGVTGTVGYDSKSTLKAIDFKNFLDIEDKKKSSTIYDNLGIPLTNRFACLLNAPKKVKFQGNGWLEFQVMSVDCPGIAIDTVQQELNGMNRYAFKSRQHDALSITFLETSELTLRDFFYQWMKDCYDVKSTGGVRRDYLQPNMASNFAIIPLDFIGKGRRVDRFRDVFPTKIQDINYNYAQAGDIVKTTVTFQYMWHGVETVNMDLDNSHTVVSRQNKPNI